MRQKYNAFDPYKINKKTIAVALKLKKQLPPETREVSLRDPDSNLVPTGRTPLLRWLCAKYLHLALDDGLPLLKQAQKTQYSIDDEYKLCEFCHKPFPYTRASKKFCNAKCRKRFERWGPKKTEGVTLRRISSDRNNSNYAVSGSLPLKQFLSVTENEVMHDEHDHSAALPNSETHQRN